MRQWGIKTKDITLTFTHVFNLLLEAWHWIHLFCRLSHLC